VVAESRYDARGTMGGTRENARRRPVLPSFPRLLVAATLCLAIAFLSSQTTAEAAKGGHHWHSISYYSPKNGATTCSGELYRRNRKTAAASPIFRLGSVLRVSWRGRSVRVVVNDCTPQAHGPHASFDLSYKAAKQLRMLKEGRIYPKDAKVEVVGHTRL
jgi:rare lipoprotein A (peptidoglycan hydrolase)